MSSIASSNVSLTHSFIDTYAHVFQQSHSYKIIFTRFKSLFPLLSTVLFFLSCILVHMLMRSIISHNHKTIFKRYNSLIHHLSSIVQYYLAFSPRFIGTYAHANHHSHNFLLKFFANNLSLILSYKLFTRIV